jgi:CheY-like chemotaxis protein
MSTTTSNATSGADPLLAPAVLVVEDDPDVRRLLRSILERDGCEVIEASNGRHALDKVRDNRTRLRAMVADLGLPEINGLELCRELVRIHPDLRVLFITGHSDDNDLLQKTPIQARLLLKPFTPRALCDAVQEVLAFPEHRAEAVCASIEG